MDAGLVLHLLPAAVILAGWVLFVVLVIKFREAKAPHPAYRASQTATTSTSSENPYRVEVGSAHEGKDAETMTDSPAPTVTIRVSGKLFESHLPYLDQLVESASGCGLWAMLDLAMLAEADVAAIRFLVRGEHEAFGIAECPAFVREWMARERSRSAA